MAEDITLEEFADATGFELQNGKLVVRLLETVNPETYAWYDYASVHTFIHQELKLERLIKAAKPPKPPKPTTIVIQAEDAEFG